jgi:hypothetical protein
VINLSVSPGPAPRCLIQWRCLVTDPEIAREEDAPAPTSKLDHKTLMIALAFGVALVLLVVLNMG